jgi:hypothetical protein
MQTVRITSKFSKVDFKFGNGGAVRAKLFNSTSTSLGAKRHRWNSEERWYSLPCGGSPLKIKKQERVTSILGQHTYTKGCVTLRYQKQIQIILLVANLPLS